MPDFSSSELIKKVEKEGFELHRIKEVIIYSGTLTVKGL